MACNQCRCQPDIDDMLCAFCNKMIVQWGSAVNKKRYGPPRTAEFMGSVMALCVNVTAFSWFAARFERKGWCSWCFEHTTHRLMT